MTEEKPAAEEEFKAKTTEELIDPQQYRNSLRNGRSQLLNMLHKVKVDFDLLEIDAAEAGGGPHEQRDEVLENLRGQLVSLTNRINEIDRRLTQAEKGDNAVSPSNEGSEGKRETPH